MHTFHDEPCFSNSTFGELGYSWEFFLFGGVLDLLTHPSENGGKNVKQVRLSSIDGEVTKLRSVHEATYRRSTKRRG